ncbi:MRC [Mytilus coruscus]|uniref:MRC n=1 Tax=Mytilus coruscus TaxID=42192 RepID=A0A6J8A2J4_MYTCO|nr:MRC [Mytilus coruscus]
MKGSILIAIFFHITFVQSECQRGWLHFGNSCYFISDTRKTWADAANFCRAYNARLASVETRAENDFLTDIIRLKNGLTERGYRSLDNDYWIDGTDEIIEGEWIWAESGMPLTYTNWMPGTPDLYEPREENCLEIVKWTDHVGQWNDDHCIDTSHFICEMEGVNCQNLIFNIPLLKTCDDAVEVKSECQRGWLHFGNSCYFLSDAEKNWTDAAIFCRAYNSRLASVETRAENDFLTNIIRLRNGLTGNLSLTSDYWIGGTDEKIEGEWIWAESGKPLTYTNWVPGTPDLHLPREEHCLEIVKWKNHVGQWNDDYCIDPSYFICEMKYPAGVTGGISG